jgi:uncharacterized integral membrane protein (TIGR00697 family)
MQKINKGLISLTMVYMSVMICSDLLVYKPVSMWLGYTTAATLIFPLWFVLNDIIAEIYGYAQCRNIMLTGFTVQLIFYSVCYLAIHLPSPPDWKFQSAYNYILSPLLKISISTFFAFVISGIINIRLITKWKILLMGRFFWLRSIGASTISEALYSFLNAWLILYGAVPLVKIPGIILWSYLLKTAYTIIMAYPATILVELIRKIDHIDIILENELKNPFKY